MMASCVKTATVAVSGSTYLQLNGATASADGSTFLMPDSTTPISTCPMVLLSAGEYNDMAGTFIATPADAMTISAAFAVLIATAGVFRVLIRQIWDSDYSDEKH